MVKMIVGRSPPEDAPRVLVNDRTVSRQHCSLIEIGGGQYEIEDLGSTGGTWVLEKAGWRSVRRERVGRRDEVKLGNHVVRIADLLAQVSPPVRAEPARREAVGPFTVQRDPETGEIVRRYR